MRRTIIPAVILVLLAGLGCDIFRIPTNGNGNGGELQWPPLTPRAVIENIQWCYNNANLVYYSLLLDVVNFVFYFDDQDVDQGLPPSWTYNEEIEATGNLFDAVGAANITLVLNFEGSGDTEPPPGDTEFEIKDVGYDLRVITPEVIYQANAHANFHLSQFEDGEGLMRWWLTLWWDIVA